MSEENVSENVSQGNAAVEPGFMITISKQSMLTGEVITVATNLPKGSESEDIREMIDRITRAIDWRLPQVREVADNSPDLEVN